MNEVTKELSEDEKKLVKKWQILIDKCGNLSTDEQKLMFASTLEALRNKAAASGGSDIVLEDNGNLNVMNVAGTKRLVLGYDEKGEFEIVHQRKDWVND